MVLLVVVAVFAGLIGSRLPGGFVPDEDQGYLYVNVQLPLAASLERTAAVNDKLDAILKDDPGRQVLHRRGRLQPAELRLTTTYNAFYFVTLEDWDERDKHGLTADVIMRNLNHAARGRSRRRRSFAFSPPVIPGIGTSGGVTFMLEDRAGKDPAFLAENTAKFLAAARQRPEFALLFTTLLPSVPQFFADVDRDKVLKQGINSRSVYQTLQAFLGGAFVNYFNQFGRVWQVYVQAEGEFRTQAETRRVSSTCATPAGQPVPLSTLVTMKPVNGPEFTVRFNEYRAAQINGILAPGVQHPAGHAGARGGLRADHAARHGLRLLGHVVPGTGGRAGHPAGRRLRLLAARGVPAAGRASTRAGRCRSACCSARPSRSSAPSARSGSRRFELDVFSQIGLIMVIGLAAKNAILIVEFAKDEHERGASLVDAALAGARVRLRPILMTAFAFILGVLPLVISTGRRRQLATDPRHDGHRRHARGHASSRSSSSRSRSTSSERFRRKPANGAAAAEPLPAPISGGGGRRASRGRSGARDVARAADGRRDRRGRVPGRLRDRPGLQASARGRGPTRSAASRRPRRRRSPTCRGGRCSRTPS